MRISEAAAASGLSVYTIRYYEQAGMLPRIERMSDGHRQFSRENIEWLTLLYWLRETGMTMKQMRRFTTLAQSGQETVPERRQILMDHSAQLQKRRDLIDRCEAILAVKIDSYSPSKKRDNK